MSGVDALRRRLREALRDTRPSPPGVVRVGGLPVELSRAYLPYLPATFSPAAVLIPVLDRPQGLSLLLTERAQAMRTHAGQIAFPGGRIEPGDADAAAAALREAEEEVGLAREFVDVLGYLDDQVVVSGFRVTPVVGLVRPGFALRLDPTEVARVFEVPLDYVIDPKNHRPRRVLLGGQELHLKDLAYEGDTIWGATGGMLIALAATLADAAAEATHDHR